MYATLARVQSATFTDAIVDPRWTPIRGCPGRFVFRGPATTTIDDLIGAGSSKHAVRFVSARARDPVDVVAFASGGGLICYLTGDGTHVHTLCDPAGFARKLADFGLEPPSPASLLRT